MAREIEFEIQAGGPEWTDSPRDLTQDETDAVLAALRNGRIEAIKLYRSMTNATLAASVRFTTALLAKRGA